MPGSILSARDDGRTGNRSVPPVRLPTIPAAPYIPAHDPRPGPRGDARLPGRVPDLSRLDLPEQLLPRSAVGSVAGTGESVSRPLGKPRRGGLVRCLVGGAGGASLALWPGHRGA